MIDPRLVRENPDLLRQTLKLRRMESAVDLDRLVAIDDERRSLSSEAELLREKRNRSTSLSPTSLALTIFIP